MNLFLLNVVLALLWGAITGEFTPGNFLMGFVMGYAAIFIARPVLGPARYTEKVWVIIAFVAYFLQQLFMSSLRVARDVITNKLTSNAGVVSIPIDDLHTDGEITLLANFISLTPGTLSLDVSSDRQVLYIHSMYIENDDVNLLRAEIDQIKRRVKRVIR